MFFIKLKFIQFILKLNTIKNVLKNPIFIFVQYTELCVLIFDESCV